MPVFKSADFWIPPESLLPRWAVIACDQFTSEKAYWERVSELVGDAPSALKVIFPEAYLGEEGRIEAINQNMVDYLHAGFFRCFPDSYILVERTLKNGLIRRGLLGVIDLEAYDFSPRAETPIRATERTVPERIPPRVKIREKAAMELSHVLLLCDDDEMTLLNNIQKGEALYSFDLMMGGGHIAGWRVCGEEARRFEKRLAAYEKRMDQRCAPLPPVYFAVGDGNHSLATAKRCWERDHRERFAMVELQNIRDESQQFEPIHRVVKNVNVPALLKAAEAVCAPEGYPVPWHAAGRQGVLRLNPALGQLPVGILQRFLDEYGQGETDYIHGEESAIRLSAAENTVAFLLTAIDKAALFPSLAADGVLPRKTFSMGHAEEKRYYLEARSIGQGGSEE